jgi:hypothetical protein
MAGEAPTVEELQAQNKKLQDEQAEKDRKIQDLEAEKATLSKRAETVQAPQQTIVPQGVMTDEQIEAETNRIETLRATDPAKAAKENAQLLKKISSGSANAAAGAAASNIQPAIEQAQFIDKIKAENADLLEVSPAMEDIIAAEANRILQGIPQNERTQKKFQETVKKVVSEKRESLKHLLKPKDEKKPDVPAGARSEDGGAAPGGAPKKPAGGTNNDGVDKTSPSERMATASQKGLF